MAEGKHDVSQRMFVLLLVFLVGLMGFWAFRMYEFWNNAHGNYTREITVDGSGRSFVVPDVAEVTLGVTTDAATSDAAVTANTKKVNAVMDALKTFKIDAKDIQTTGYYLNPKYKYSPDGTSSNDGYTLNETVLVKVRDFTKVGEILAVSTKAGANTVGGVNFTVDDAEKGRAEARAQAIEKAKAKAAIIADQAGFSLGDLVNYYESPGAMPYYDAKGGYAPMAAEGGGGVVNSPQISAGQQEVNMTVNLTYKLR